MNVLHVKYLLVGGGIASSSAIQAIRQRDPIGTALLVGQESSRPYHRPPLSKEYLRQQQSRSELFALEANWFDQHNVILRTGRRVEQLDTDRLSVTLESGEEISCQQLLLATGASPVRLDLPGADLPGVLYLRTLEDCDRLQKAIEKARIEGRQRKRITEGGEVGRGRAVVIGGGVLGVELAASLTQVGMEVHLLVSGPHPWEKFAGSTTGQIVAKFLQTRGVIVHADSPPVRLEGDGRAQRVVLADKSSIPADFVVAAVGILPNKDLLRGTPIAAEKAILTDDHCRTNVPGIWAGGDCAAPFDPLFGKHRLLDHWENATVTGRIAGANMAGGNEKLTGVNHFDSGVFELNLNAWGEGRLVDRRLVRGDTRIEKPDFIEFGIATDGRIAQVLSVGHASEDEILRRLVEERTAINGNEEKLKDPALRLDEIF